MAGNCTEIIPVNFQTDFILMHFTDVCPIFSYSVLVFYLFVEKICFSNTLLRGYLDKFCTCLISNAALRLT